MLAGVRPDYYIQALICDNSVGEFQRDWPALAILGLLSARFHPQIIHDIADYHIVQVLASSLCPPCFSCEILDLTTNHQRTPSEGGDSIRIDLAVITQCITWLSMYINQEHCFSAIPPNVVHYWCGVLTCHLYDRFVHMWMGPCIASSHYQL